MRRLLLLVLVGGCGFATRSGALECDITDDCENGRTCEGGFCVVGGGNDSPDAGVSEDSGTDAAQPPDADPFTEIAAACTAAQYTPVTGLTSLYRDVPTGATWAAAQADCKNDVTDATHLIVLTSQIEADFMKTKRGWVGLFDNDTNVFASVTGEPVSQTLFFAGGQPDDGGGDENCVQWKDNNGLDDDQCGNSHRYVCECDGKPSTP